MTETLIATYYGKGASKSKNGNTRPLNGMVVGKGEPVKAWLSVFDFLAGAGYEAEDAFMRHVLERELKNFKSKL